jgi:hypothetical protein
MYNGFTESPDVILARMKRILADYQPPAPATNGGNESTPNDNHEDNPNPLTTE